MKNRNEWDIKKKKQSSVTREHFIIGNGNKKVLNGILKGKKHISCCTYIYERGNVNYI